MKPANSDEKNLFDRLAARFVEEDEKIVNSNRAGLISDYEKRSAQAVAAAAKKQQYTGGGSSRPAAVRRDDASLNKSADKSAIEYSGDLDRKLGSLEHAMITFAKSGNRKMFDSKLKWARQEPERVKSLEAYKSNPDVFDSAARQLAEYADKLEIVASEGFHFNQVLSGKVRLPGNRNLKNAEFEYQGSRFVILSHSRTQLVLQNKENRKKTTLDLVNGKINENRAWIAAIESNLLGRADQYFYFMLFNGHLNNAAALSAIAPADYWQKEVRNVLYRYCLYTLVNDPHQKSALEKNYGKSNAFKRALEESGAAQ